VDMYDRSVGHNSTLILGITPDTNGLLPEADVRRLQELGREIRRTFSNPIGTASGSGYEIELRFNAETEFDIVVIQEDIQHGERVRAYSLDIQQHGIWQALASGSCIGHKRIHRLSLERAQAIRLIINRAVALPLIKQLAIYHSKGLK